MPELGSKATAQVRRLRTRGLDPLVLVSVGLVVATLVCALLTFSHHDVGRTAGPHNVAFSAAVRGCPAAPGSTVRVGSLGSAQGGFEAGGVKAVRPSQTTDAPGGDQAFVVKVNGPAAAGLVVGAYGTDPLRGTRCLEPASDYWFTGLGAASTHNSVIHLDNPADTLARVVITRWSSKAGDQPIVDERTLAPRSSQVSELFKDAPRFGEFTIQAHVVQGQASVAVLDQLQTPGQGVLAEWLVPQGGPATSLTLLGLPQGDRRTLTIGNPSGDQITATVRLITKTSVFAPAKFGGVDVPGSGVRSIDITKVLAGQKDVVGILVEASTPITASLATTRTDDVAFTGVDPLLTAEGGAVLPDGDKSLVIGPASAAGPITVIARDASGKVVAQPKVTVSTSGSVVVGLPANAVLLQIQTNKIQIRAAVVVTGKGAVVIPVGRVIRVSTAPSVRPSVD